MNVRFARKIAVVLVALALVAVGVTSFVSRGSSQGWRPVEYRYVLFQPSYARDEQVLNMLAREGWELAGVTPQGFIMKR
jgi:hypothetical protein